MALVAQLQRDSFGGTRNTRIKEELVKGYQLHHSDVGRARGVCVSIEKVSSRGGERKSKVGKYLLKVERKL